MITNTDFKTIMSELDRSKLPSYWKKYFEYEVNEELYNLTNNELMKEIEEQRRSYKPFIDSQIIISRLLTKFGQTNKFQKHFNDKYPDSVSGQVLGMQLYHIMLIDNDVWIYYQIKKEGNLFPHSTYFK